MAELPGEGAGAAVAGNLVVLNTLRGGDQSGIHDLGLGLFTHDFLAFLQQTFHGPAFFALGTDIQGLAHLLQSLHVSLGLFQVLLEALLKLGVGRSLRHLGQGFDNLVFRVVEVAQLLYEKVFKRIQFHGVAPHD